MKLLLISYQKLHESVIIKTQMRYETFETFVLNIFKITKVCNYKNTNEVWNFCYYHI